MSDPTDAVENHDGHGSGAMASDISNLVVRLTREYTGRGPTEARTYIQDDLITVVLRDTLTKGEASLVDAGHLQHVLDTRRRFQATMESDLVAGVESCTKRGVLAFFSDNHVEPDMAVETFVLQPLREAMSTSNDGPPPGPVA
jgi:uncharacterized protein YbcI